MRKYIVPAALMVTLLFSQTGNAQTLKKLMKNVTGDSTLSGISGKLSQGSLSTTDVAAGLKEALSKGTTEGTKKLSAVNGFLQNAAIKILLPPDAEKVEKTLRAAGMGKLVDDAITSMNRAAEDAASKASPIFLNAIKGITINDAWNILKGSDTAATSYLKGKTTQPLTDAFKPVVQSSLTKVNATKYWSDLANAYNKINVFGKSNLDPDLSNYVTGKALTGIFYEIGLQEKQIRDNPAARTTELLQKVFSQQ